MYSTQLHRLGQSQLLIQLLKHLWTLQMNVERHQFHLDHIKRLQAILKRLQKLYKRLQKTAAINKWLRMLGKWLQILLKWLQAPSKHKRLQTLLKRLQTLIRRLQVTMQLNQEKGKAGMLLHCKRLRKYCRLRDVQSDSRQTKNKMCIGIFYHRGSIIYDFGTNYKTTSVDKVSYFHEKYNLINNN